MKRVLLFLLAVLAVACNYGPPKEALQKQLNGVNGPTIYVYGNDGNLKMLFKEEYVDRGFSIFLDRDTIKLGGKFSSLFAMARDSFSIRINQPSEAVITNNMERYYFIPTVTGLHDFTGEIVMGTDTVPFEFKFIVVPGNE